MKRTLSFLASFHVIILLRVQETLRGIIYSNNKKGFKSGSGIILTLVLELCFVAIRQKFALFQKVLLGCDKDYILGFHSFRHTV